MKFVELIPTLTTEYLSFWAHEWKNEDWGVNVRTHNLNHSLIFSYFHPHSLQKPNWVVEVSLKNLSGLLCLRIEYNLQEGQNFITYKSTNKPKMKHVIFRNPVHKIHH